MLVAREKVEFDVIGRDVGGSKAFKDVGDAADKAGDKIDGFGKTAADAADDVKGLGDKTETTGEKTKATGEQYRGLAADIEHTRGEIRRLAEEIDKTGNKDLFKDLRKSQSELRKLMSAKNLLLDFKGEGRQAGSQFLSAFSDQLFTAMSATRLGPVFGPPLIGAAVAAAPLLSAVISGAVTAGVGIGVAGIGVAIASRNQQVKDAAAELGQEFSVGLSSAASSFVPATLKAIDTIRHEFRLLLPDIAKLFNTAVPYVQPLANAITGAVREIIPGLQEATRNAAPLIDVLAKDGPAAAKAFGDALATLSQNSGNSAQAMHVLFQSVNLLVTQTAGTINLLNKALPFLAGPVLLVSKALDGTGVVAGRVAGPVNDVGNAFTNAAGKAETFTDTLRRLNNENIDAGLAQIQLREQMRTTAETITANGHVVDANGNALKGHAAAADASRTQLYRLAQQTLQTSDAVLKQTGSQESANAVAQRGRDKFVALATSMGMDKTAAERLAASLIAIPNKNVKVTADTGPAMSVIMRLQQYKIKDKTFYINGVYRPLNIAGQGHVGGFSVHAEGGRIRGPGTDTSDDIVTRVSNGEYVIRARAARAIGYDTLDALNQADRRPLASSSSGGSSRPARRGDDERLVRLWRRAMDGMSIVLEDRTGQKAYLRARTGG